LAAASTAYEINLQHSLTAPPIVFGQGIGTSSNNIHDSSKSAVGRGAHTNLQMSLIFDKLTGTPNSIFSRKIQPSLFVGTRGMVASTAAYMFGGPSSEHEKLHWKFREILVMTHDGARLAIDWEVPRLSPDAQTQQQPPPLLPFEQRKAEILQGPIQQPVVLLFHGINNDSSFGYMQSLQRTFANRGWAAAAINFRGVGGVPMTTPRGYNAAFTGDIRNVILQLSSRLDKDVPLFLVGNSLGANLMTKYLGEEGYAGTLPHCVGGAVSLGNPMQIHSAHVPFPLNIVMGIGVKKILLENRHLFHDVNDPHWQATTRKAMLASTIGNFDKVIAPQLVRNEPFPPYAARIGYETGEDYWHDSSSYRHIRNISVPFLNLTAGDDLLVSTPSRNKLGYSLANPNVMVAETRCGGHLGWQESPPDSKSILDFGASPWADTAASDFFQAILDTKAELKRRSGLPIHNNDKNQMATTIEGVEVEGGSSELARSRIVDEARLSSAAHLRSKL
jgi:predicted alpha/beta-fold hydrolase